MTVEPERAAAKVEHDGKTYYFCSQGCAGRFEQAPEKYADAGGRTPTSPAVQGQWKTAAPTATLPAAEAHAGAQSSSKEVRYTCPMHPQIVQLGPGSCPICGMALEPMDVSAEVQADPEYDSMRRRFWVSAALSLPLLVLSMFGEYLGLHLAPGLRN